MLPHSPEHQHRSWAWPLAALAGVASRSACAVQLPALQQDCESIQAKKHELATCTQQKMLGNREMIRCVYKLCY